MLVRPSPVISSRARQGTFAVLLITGLIAGAGSVAQADSRDHSTALQQVGTYDYLTQPDFAGLATVAEIASGNTIGLGTFENLDGELVMVGGDVFQVRPDGTPREPAPSTRTPFMQAIDFTPTTNAPVPPGTQCAELPSYIQEVAQQSNGIIAVRVRGTFSDLTTRSVSADPPPYQPISVTIAEETKFPLGEQRAVLVGFWQGKDALGVGQDGLHLHGLTADRSAGGHVLSCTAGNNVQLSLQPVTSVHLHTPGS